MILIIIIFLITATYTVLIVSYSFGLRRVLSRPNPPIDSAKSISVIVAFKDEAKNLPKLLDAIANQSLSKDRFELILINDHSSDSFESIAYRFAAVIPNFRLLNLPNGKSGKKAAIAFGVESALYPLIALTDADCEPSKDWLESILCESEKGSTLILGPVVMSPINTLLEKIQALDYASLMASAAGSCGIGRPVIASSASLAFRNDLLKVNDDTLVSGVSSGDDMFLLHHAKRLKNGVSFLRQKSAIVRTSTVSSFSEAIAQRVRWSSKSTKYTDSDTISVGFIVLLFNLSIIVSLGTSIFIIDYIFFFLALIVVKSIVDYILLYRYLKFIEQKELLKVFLPLQLVYPFYICYSFFVGVFKKTNWKGRPVN